MTEKPLRVLIVDDSVHYRGILIDLLTEMSNLEVVGTATNGRSALTKIASLKPDLVTLDIDMPEMDGLATLQAIRETLPGCIVVMVSSLANHGIEITLKALEMGAFDFIVKPDASDRSSIMERLRAQFLPILKMILTKRTTRGILNGSNASIELVVIGISTGGPEALSRVIPKLPADLGVPVLIVQHMPTMFTEALANSLDKKSVLQVVEGKENDRIAPGKIIIAPGGKHMKVIKIDNEYRIMLSDDPPENFCKPSVDYLFRSVAMAFQGHCLAVIMTGMGNDGANGLKLLKEKGCPIIAQDKETSTVYGMPMEAVKTGVVDWIVPLDQIAKKIESLVKGYD